MRLESTRASAGAISGVTHDVGKVLREILSGLRGLPDAEACSTVQANTASTLGLYFLPNVVYPGISLSPVGQKIVMNINVANLITLKITV